MILDLTLVTMFLPFACDTWLQCTARVAGTRLKAKGCDRGDGDLPGEPLLQLPQALPGGRYRHQALGYLLVLGFGQYHIGPKGEKKNHPWARAALVPGSEGKADRSTTLGPAPPQLAPMPPKHTPQLHRGAETRCVPGFTSAVQEGCRPVCASSVLSSRSKPGRRQLAAILGKGRAIRKWRLRAKDFVSFRGRCPQRHLSEMAHRSSLKAH